MKYFCCDTETGGIDPREVDLLSGHIVILDDGFNVLDSLGFEIKKELYRVKASAMKINKIDLVRLYEEGETIKDIETKIYRLLKKHTKPKEIGLDNGSYVTQEQPLQPLGHSFNFDYSFLKETFRETDWDKLLARRVRDTQIVASYLKDKCVLPQDLEPSLANLSKHYGIVDLPDHTPKKDTNATIEVYKCMLRYEN